MSDLKPGIDHVGVSTSFICHDGRGRFLLHKRSKNCRDGQGTWDVGGGKLEFGLTLEENVLREVMEEYGCAGKIQEQLPSFCHFAQQGERKTHWVAVPFIIQVDARYVRLNEPEKMDEIGWFTLDDLPSPLHPGTEVELKELRGYLKKYERD